MRSFDWDDKKAQRNIEKHGISFQTAIEAFDDLGALVRQDVKHSSVEQRYVLIGRGQAAILTVVFTVRDQGGIFRLISVRRAKRKERRIYEKEH